MSFSRPVCLLWLLVGLVPALRAEDAKKPATEPAAKTAPTAPSEDTVDEDFLEFLGSLDLDEADEELMEYLARQTPAATEDKK